MIYFTSDLHLGHNNMIKFRDRPFHNVSEMNTTLLKNINNTCSKRDMLFILGDIAYQQPVEQTEEQLSSLKPTLVLIRGNHDKAYNPKLFHTIKDYCEIKVYHRKVILSHYPFLEWDGMLRGAVHLHGHQHNYEKYNIDMRNQKILRYDVGVDANYGVPVSIEQIFQYFHLDTDNFNNSMKHILDYI